MKKLFKWIGIALGGLLGLLALTAIVFYFVGRAKLSKKYDVSVQTVSIPTDAEAVQRGKHLATIFLCKDCHGENLNGAPFGPPGSEDMPWKSYGQMTDEEISAIWQYLQSLPKREQAR